MTSQSGPAGKNDQASHAETDSLDSAAELDNTRLWVIGQLGMLLKMAACTEDLAKRILQMLAVVAFVNVGPKAAKSRLVALNRMAGVIDVAASVRLFAVARVSVLATESLPCMSSRKTHPKAKGGAANEGGATSKKEPAPAAQHSDATLLPEVCILSSIVLH
jgi:hypothetical protein